jgi:hypothetical protein
LLYTNWMPNAGSGMLKNTFRFSSFHLNRPIPSALFSTNNLAQDTADLLR